ncbi:MAG TPA: zinc ribbon domain-containing protein [Solirubrobacterales bacterium]|nr:zinc ribbon domain-containing protein [Solirubrobacterales bacterium]
MSDPGDGPMVGGSGEKCPSCGAALAPGQRYCLECGHRRGDPRLPFMDAVVFMEAINKPQTPAAPPPQARESRPRGISANASLIAGIATLVLAIGVGVLIGRSGDNGSATAANAAPQIIKVGGGGEESATPSEATGDTKTGGKKEKGKAKADKSKKAEEKAETGSSGTSKAAEEVLKPTGDVKLAPPKQEVGGKCEKGTAGCSGSGEFDGSFFGE